MKRPSFQFYPADWLSSMTITMMDAAHEGAYIRLLCYDWMNDGIPDDDAKLASISRLGEGWFKGGSTVLRVCFKHHPTKEGFLTNSRLQTEREKQDEWREKSKAGGLKSAESRRKKAVKGGSTSVARVVQPKGNTSSSSSSSITPLPPKGEWSESINQLWLTFPPKSRERSSKADFLKAYKKAVNKPDTAVLLESAKQWAACKDWQKDNGQFAPSAHRWLTSRKWESSPEDQPKGFKDGGQRPLWD